jgi:hypothetical protein
MNNRNCFSGSHRVGELLSHRINPGSATQSYPASSVLTILKTSAESLTMYIGLPHLDHGE